MSEPRVRLVEGFVARVPLAPVEEFVPAFSTDLLARLAELAAAEADLQRALDAADAALHARIGATTDKAERGRLLELKRSLRRGKPPQAPPDALRELLAPLAEGRARCDDARARFEAAYAAAEAASSAELARSLGDERLTAALEAATSQLLSEVDRARGERAKLVASNASVRGALINYRARWALKSSPFGLFVGIGAGRIRAEGNSGLRFGADALRVEMIPDLAHVTRWLMSVEKELRRARAMPLSLTHLVTVREEQVQFTVYDEQLVIFTREIPRSDAVDAVLDSFADATERSWRDVAVAVLEAIGERDPDAPEPPEPEALEPAFSFIDDLVSAGLVECRTPLPLFDRDPLGALAHWFGKLDHPLARRTARRLGRLARSLQALERGAATSRQAIERAHRMIDRGLPATVPGRQYSRRVLVETALPDASFELAEDALGPLRAAMARLYRLSTAMYGPDCTEVGNASSQHGLASLMKDDEQEVDLPELFRRARRESGVVRARAEGDVQRPETPQPGTERGQAVMRRLFERARAAGRAGLTLHDAALDEILGPDAPAPRLPAIGTLQLAVGQQSGGGWTYALENVSIPPFFLMSRFSLLLSSEPAGEALLAAWRAHDARLEELLGSRAASWLYAPSLLNTITASRQPQLLPRVLPVCGPRPLLEGGVLHASDVVAVRDPALPGEAWLVHQPTGERIDPFMHGIIDVSAFSLWQYAWASTNRGRLSTLIWSQQLLDPGADAAEDRALPRISLGPVVLHRASWRPSLRRVDEWRRLTTARAFFVALNRWLDEAGAPELVWAQATGELRKPLPILRGAPAAVEELWRQLRAEDAPAPLRFTECYPTPAMAPVRSERGSHVAELLVGMEVWP